MRWFNSVGCFILFTFALLSFTSYLTVCLSDNQSFTWLAGFRYRMPIKSTEKSGTALKDYQVRLAIQGVDPNRSWCVDFSRIQPGGRDIRFVNEQQQLLDFWIQAWDDTAKTAIIWIKVPEIKAKAESIIYLYYGNPQAGSLSSFVRTMKKLRVDKATVGLWHFDKPGKTVLDSSPHKNHSVFSSARWLGHDGGGLGSLSPYLPAGEVGRSSPEDSLLFNGRDEYVEIPYADSLDFTGTERLSLEAWVCPTARIGAQGQYAAILSKRGMYALYLNAEGKISYYLWGPKPRDYHTSKSALPLNEWSHIAVTYNGQQVSFYLNGRLDNEVKVNGLIRPMLGRVHDQKSPLYIGNDPNPEYSRFFQGAIDEVRILRRILSEGEVKADYERRAYASAEPELSLGEEESIE